MALIDSEQRAEATDPRGSFIVQAPAGSGKTEILTQRYLRLLSTVSAPEQIIALTFTRKAASEMRERIIHALQQAASHYKATSPHQQTTLNFAQKALQQNEQYQWNLLQQSNRLKVITIDSLCQSINQSIPLLEQQIAYAQISDKPEQHYLNAARQCIAFALETPEYQGAIRILLMHVDNRQEQLVHLLRQLLSQRDQWLSPLFQARSQDKSVFEQALRFIEQHELDRLKKSLPHTLANELVHQARTIALIEHNAASPRHMLSEWEQFEHINQNIAQALCALILGSDRTIRKSFDHHVGLKSDSCPKEQYRRIKEESKELLAQLNDCPDFLAALLQVSTLPKPEYDPEQWEVLHALFLLLPVLLGHLHVLFSEHNEVDFTAMSQQALQALGDAEQPTDLALYLDNSIHHLLVDEFQDTSITQFDLLTQLVQGWQTGDGKTLFIVGDPMQSIYRFRQAEVGLFFRAKNQGIGPVTLRALELRCNFRSTTNIVHWVNQHFVKVFPQHSDIESGAVPFHPSTPVLAEAPTSGVYAVECASKEEEAEYLVQQVQQELEVYPQQSIAILVRSRSQLSAIIKLLRERHIPYQGTDIDCLAHLIHLRDVWSLTQALLMPGNRLAWLSVLRSPYCGIQLADLHLIAQFSKKNSIYATLLQLDKIQGLSIDGHTRAQFFIQVMHQALEQRAQRCLSDWVRTTLKKCHSDSILSPAQLDDLEQYWSLLDRYEEQGRLPKISEFLLELNKLYSQQSTTSRLQIMTIHKSKGLEFDTVFLPGLGSSPKRRDAPMLRWLKIPTEQNNNLLLLSPIKAAHHEHCALYDYLGSLDEEKTHYELQRVLYVAVTRAKSRLYLLDNSSKNSKNSFRFLLQQQEFTRQQQEKEQLEEARSLPVLQRLPLHFYTQENTTTPQLLNAPSAGLSSSIPRLIGIVTHKLLQWICDKHPQSPEELPWYWVQHEFKKMGLEQSSINHAMETITNQVAKLYQDPIGQWLLARHEKEHNEYELLVEYNSRLVTRIIDRTFEEHGHLWIIDFKTGKEDQDSQQQHQQQLNEYAYYLSDTTTLPIQCGVYYLTTNHWVSWVFEALN